MEIIKLNLIPSGVNPICHAKQYDEGRIIRFAKYTELNRQRAQYGLLVRCHIASNDTR